MKSSVPKNTGQFGKGNPGKPKGVPNKMTGELREMIRGALEQAGGQTYLAQQAKENPAAFLTLLGKILPKEIRAEVAATHTIQRLTPEEQRGIAEAILGR